MRSILDVIRLVCVCVCERFSLLIHPILWIKMPHVLVEKTKRPFNIITLFKLESLIVDFVSLNIQPNILTFPKYGFSFVIIHNQFYVYTRKKKQNTKIMCKCCGSRDLNLFFLLNRTFLFKLFEMFGRMRFDSPRERESCILCVN